MKIKIEFLSWVGRAALEIEARSIKEAIESAAKDGANLYGATLDGANLYGANLYGANLYGANLRCATLYGANLYGANLRCANLYGANLRCATLDGANLRCATLDGANLYGATLDGATLDGANLYGANLYGANLRCATLDGANLDGANLYGANLRCANLYGANLDGAKYGDKQLWTSRPVLQLGPCGRIGRTTVVFFFADGSKPLIRCGCFTGTIEKFREKIHETHKGTFHELEYNALASHIEAIYQIQKDELKKQETDNETL